MIYENKYSVEINNIEIKKHTLFKTKFINNKIHLVEINPETNNYIVGGKYLVFNRQQVKSELFNKVFKQK